MTLALHIVADTDAFGTSDPARNRELARILRQFANRLERYDGADHGAAGTLLDGNGNTVGKWRLT